MKITFLGTGTSQGIPVIACPCKVCKSINQYDKRLRSSVHITVQNKSYIIDCGPDFRQQVLREKITHLDALIFTHEHKDHTAGLDDVRAFNFAQGKDMPIYGRKRVLDQLKMEYSYAFAEKKYPGVPLLETHLIDSAPFSINKTAFIPIEVMHLKLPVLGFRIENFTYITDANYISNEEKEKIKGSKVLVLNALQKEKHISHFNLTEAIKLAQEIGAEKTYFTHISHKLGLHNEISAILPKGIALAYDGLSLEI